MIGQVLGQEYTYSPMSGLKKTDIKGFDFSHVRPIFSTV
jgi:hypothetical protein